MNRFETTVSDETAFVDSTKMNIAWTSALYVTDFERRVKLEKISKDEEKMKEPNEQTPLDEARFPGFVRYRVFKRIRTRPLCGQNRRPLTEP